MRTPTSGSTTPPPPHKKSQNCTKNVAALSGFPGRCKRQKHLNVVNEVGVGVGMRICWLHCRQAYRATLLRGFIQGFPRQRRNFALPTMGMSSCFGPLVGEHVTPTLSNCVQMNSLWCKLAVQSSQTKEHTYTPNLC